MSGSLTEVLQPTCAPRILVLHKKNKNETKVEVGEGSTLSTSIIGKWHGRAIDRKTGKKLKSCLNKTLLVPRLMNNLFSLTQ